ncbi:TetR/AcrR family transcriptional regulator [Rhodoferax sp.]|uniref:TetR/AcrR family transcriptional regulator n=1 Tax=Rhodoferax sp. TaxID=50421 RepID=UPI0025DF25E0|nr:TetR/AcrR family transcriptional regulator [Rhodoferax sp.]MCM2340410.1 TetR family transcriptional regulator [Rhodoferax sp.]
MSNPVTTQASHKTLRKSTKSAAKGGVKSGNVRDSAKTLQNILEVASREFERKGYSGARIDAIAEATRTSKRMIYYHFEGKEGLYIAVLEAAYRRIREIEPSLHLEDLDPVNALRELTGFTYDYHLQNPGFVRLVMTENIHNGAFLARSKVIQTVNNPAIEMIATVYERGVASGAFRTGLRPIDLHFLISAQSFYNVSNRKTFALIFKQDFESPEAIALRRANIIESVIRMVLK